jgi:nickel transport protein
MERLFAAAILILTLPAGLFAHGVDVFDETGRPGIRAVRFAYTDGEPMLFAKVKVFAPSSPDAPAQESVADRSGCFSFFPFESGDWRLTAEDGMGHKGEIVISIADETGAAETDAVMRNSAPAGRLPKPLAAALGLSLVFNVFGVWYFVGKKFLGKEAGHAH